MGHEILIKKYENYCKSKLSNSSVASNIRFASDILKMADSINKPIEAFNENDVINLIKSFNPYGDRGFKWVKSITNAFLHWLVDEKIDCKKQIEYLENLKAIESIYSETIGKYYFRNFKDIQFKLDMYIKNLCLIENSHESTYDTCKAIIYLSWIGIDSNDICDVLKTDINYTNGIISFQDKKRVAEDNLLDFLYDYSQATSYIRKAAKDQVEYSYKPSVYLIRTAKSDHLTPSAVKCLISKLNAKDADWPIRYQLKKIRQSGVFCRAYKKQLEMGPVPNNNIGRGKSLSDKEIEYFKTLFETDYEWEKAKDTLVKFENYVDFFYN